MERDEPDVSHATTNAANSTLPLSPRATVASGESEPPFALAALRPRRAGALELGCRCPRLSRDAALAKRTPHGVHGLLGLVDFEHQPRVALVAELYYDGFVRVHHVPEDALTVADETAGRDHPRKICAEHPPAW